MSGTKTTWSKFGVPEIMSLVDYFCFSSTYFFRPQKFVGDDVCMVGSYPRLNFSSRRSRLPRDRRPVVPAVYSMMAWATRAKW